MQDNVFVMSNRKTKYPTLQLDLRSVFFHTLSLYMESVICRLHINHNNNLWFCRLIKDLVVIIVSATAGGIIFSCLGQPVSRPVIL